MTFARVDEELAGLLVADEVQLAPAEALLDVLQAVVLVRRRAQRLGQHGDSLDAQRQLAATRAEDDAVDADEVAEVELEQALHDLLARGRRAWPAAAGGPSGRPGPGTPSCPGRGARAGARRCGDGPRSRRRPPGPRGRRGPSAIGVDAREGVRERVDAVGAQPLELGAPDGEQLVGRGSSSLTGRPLARQQGRRDRGPARMSRSWRRTLEADVDLGDLELARLAGRQLHGDLFAALAAR